jgi:hypothetical protein
MQRRLVDTDVSGKPVGTASIFQRPDCVNLEFGTDSLYRNVGNYQSTQSNISEERKSQIYLYF